MNNKQWIVIFSAITLFIALYFGCDTTPESHKVIENQRAISSVSTDINALLMEAKGEMGPKESASVLALESDLEMAKEDAERADVLRQLSGAWYRLGKPALAGYYAGEVATLENNEEAWSIAGTTYLICVQREEEEKVRSYCADQAVQALENALSLNPDNIQHKVNLALVYAENPPQDNPMKGVLMLVDLNKKYPDNVPVLTQLGRLAIKTGQYDKAVQRLSRAVTLEPDNTKAICLLGRAYEGTGDAENAARYLEQCGIVDGE